MLILKIVFWCCIALVVYTYIGYGAVLFVILKVKKMFFGKEARPILPLNEDLLPDVTLMVCAYNEEEVVDEKMQNIRQLNYPKDKLCVMWVTDGSTDRTNELLGNYSEVKLVFSPERKGKAMAMQHGLRENKAPYVVFTDANTMLNADAIREIVRQFMKKNVSCVSGEKRVAARRVGEAAAEGEGLYWKYESTLKRLDSELYSAMGAAGELCAIRTPLYRQMPHNTLLDDFVLSMLIVDDGYLIDYNPEAYAMEYGSASMQEESKRKRRIAAGGLQSTWRLRRMLNPFRRPLVAFQLLSHRVLRWTVTPFALVALVPLNVLLVLLGGGWLYTVLLLMQALFYAAAFAGWMMERTGRKNKLLYVPYYFLFMNLNVFKGIAYLQTHHKGGTWEKAKRG